MSLSRLKELSSLLSPTQVDEAEKSDKPAKGDFHSTMDFINDSLADLGDSLGKGGTLSKFTDAATAADIAKAFSEFKKHIDKHLTNIEVDLMAGEADDKVDEGQEGTDLNKPVWVTRQNNGQTQQFKAVLHASDTNGDTVTLETNPDKKYVIRKEDQGQDKKYLIAPRTVTEGRRLTEAKDYSDSGEFTDELFDISSHISKMKQITRQPRWTNWMQVTDDNYSTSCVALNKDFAVKLGELDKAFDSLEDELHNAQ